MENSIKVTLRSFKDNTFQVDDALHMVTGFGLCTYTLIPSEGNEWLLTALHEGKQLSMNLSSDGLVGISFNLKYTKLESAMEVNNIINNTTVASNITLPQSEWIKKFFASNTMTGYRINCHLDSESGIIRFFANVPCSIIDMKWEEWLPSDR